VDKKMVKNTTLVTERTEKTCFIKCNFDYVDDL